MTVTVTEECIDSSCDSSLYLQELLKLIKFSVSLTVLTVNVTMLGTNYCLPVAWGPTLIVRGVNTHWSLDLNGVLLGTTLLSIPKSKLTILIEKPKTRWGRHR